MYFCLLWLHMYPVKYVNCPASAVDVALRVLLCIYSQQRYLWFHQPIRQPSYTSTASYCHITTDRPRLRKFTFVAELCWQRVYSRVTAQFCLVD
jgi:hypothetical protein